MWKTPYPFAELSLKKNVPLNYLIDDSTDFVGVITKFNYIVFYTTSLPLNYHNNLKH